MIWLLIVLWCVAIASIVFLILTVRRRRRAMIAARVWRPDRSGHGPRVGR
jgi:hypothetical protein